MSGPYDENKTILDHMRWAVEHYPPGPPLHILRKAADEIELMQRALRNAKKNLDAGRPLTAHAEIQEGRRGA